MLDKEIEFPLFHLGTYTSQDGSKVTFTEELLQQLERNTNLVLQHKAMQAPVAYDHPATGSAAHGVLTGARYANGVLHVKGTKWSDELVKDAKSFKRLTYSGEYQPKFSFVQDGKPIEVGPTVVGVAMLGAKRAAIKNPAMKPLSAFEFGEGVDALHAWIVRQELGAAGLVAADYDGKLFFGEVENDARRFMFEEEKKEHQMTDAEITALVTGQVAPLKVELEAAKATIAKQDETIKNFGESTTRAADAKAYVGKLVDEKPLGKLATERLEDILADPTVPTAVVTKIKAFAEALPATVVGGGRAKKNANAATDPDDDDTDEPKALAAVKPKHFADIDANESIIDAGIVALSEHEPKLKLDTKKPDEQIKALRAYVTKRDIGDE